MKIRTKVNLHPYTTFRIGGQAEFFCAVKTAEELKQALAFAERHGLARTIIGGGSNLLVADEGVPGLVIKVACDRFVLQGARARLGAGMPLDAGVDKMIRRGMRGMESLSAIPGTIGGAVYGNAGAWGKSISDMVNRVRYFDAGELKEYSKEQCGFGYRTSVFKEMPGVVLWEIELECELGDSIPLLNTRRAICAYRAVRYPRRARSAGSFFKNVPLSSVSEEARALLPPYAFSGKEISAGYLIEQAGFLGKRVGDAQVCEHQGNFFINRGRARSRDVIELARMIQKAIETRFGVSLHPEVQHLGFSGNPFA